MKCPFDGEFKLCLNEHKATLVSKKSPDQVLELPVSKNNTFLRGWKAYRYIRMLHSLTRFWELQLEEVLARWK